jgi:hypothetical protein
MRVAVAGVMEAAVVDSAVSGAMQVAVEAFVERGPVGHLVVIADHPTEPLARAVMTAGDLAATDEEAEIAAGSGGARTATAGLASKPRQQWPD